MEYEGLIGAFIGALSASVLAYAGWMHAAKQAAKKNMADYRKNQIDQFYGPMLGHIQYAQAIFDLAKMKLPTWQGADGVEHIDFKQFGHSASGVAHSAIWDFFQQQYFIKINAHISLLINQQRYYVESSALNALLDAFLEHESQGNCLHHLWTTLKESSDELQNTGYPAGLNALLLQEYQAIQQDYRQLSGINS